jgi:hypothetical protein
MGGPNMTLTRVAILVGKVDFNEPVPVNVNVNALDVDGIVEPSV